ncbi:MAG: TonB-dependent receptor [Chitinophagaceae bacterium]|nr:TonB-dependent receptor [Chitinophagaceae bacterium]
MKKRLMITVLIPAWFLFLFSFTVFAQQGSVSGKITDAVGNPVGKASVGVKGTSTGTTANDQGEFILNNIAGSRVTLVITAVGFEKQELKVLLEGGKSEKLNVSLAANVNTEDEVVVTGVFDKRKKMESSIAITTIGTQQLDRIVPVSSVEMLKYVPGVFVNSSRGEVETALYSRGMSLSSGYYYVSMQEDGLPVLAFSGFTIASTSINPDGFLRADATIAKVEAVRGGTASILGANAPGGIFNYVSKTGSSRFAGEVRTRFGLEGDGKNPYYRLDANFGGPLSKDKSWTYNIGGFYRRADGAKYPGYTLNYGGQLKGNIVKKYKSGSLKLWVKWLNDHTSPFEFTPTIGFSNPKPAGSFTNSSSVLIQDVQFNVPASATGGLNIDYDTKNVRHYKDNAAGFNWEQDLGKGWTLNNAFKYSKKEIESNSTQIVFPFAINTPTFYGVLGQLGGGGPPRFGTYSFYDNATGNELASVTWAPGPNGFVFTLNKNTLPGANVQPASVFYTPNPYVSFDVKEVMDQLTLTKKLKNMSFTAGGFIAASATERYAMIPSAQSFSTIEDKPRLVGIRYVPLGPPGTPTYQITSPQGIANYGGAGVYYNYGKTTQSALFFGHNWQISDKLNLDWGGRYENFAIKARFYSPRVLPNTKGPDNDTLTLYNNRVRGANAEKSFDKTLGTFSYSIGLNYKVSNSLAFYGRYSEGRKSPDLSFYFDFSNQEQTSNIDPEAQTTQQFELGVKLKKEKLNLFVTPFLSILKNVPNFQVFQNPDVTYYSPPRKYQKTHTAGVEIEANYAFTKNFSVRAAGVIQTFKADEYYIYLARTNGPADDTLVVYSGNKTDNIAPLMFNITPTYSNSRFYASLNWQYMGKRWANVANAFQMPSYHAFDLNLGWTFSKTVQLSASINNLFNTYGVMGWAAPGGFPAALDIQGFTASALAANPNAVYSTLAIQPRSYFVTATFKF